MEQINIRPYTESDFETIVSWWDGQNEVPPTRGFLIPNGTLVLEYDTVPSMSITVYLTQCPEVAYFVGYCARPGMDKEVRRKCGEFLFEYGYEFLRINGYKRVNILAHKEGLVRRYKELGMQEYIGDVVAMGRIL